MIERVKSTLEEIFEDQYDKTLLNVKIHDRLYQYYKATRNKVEAVKLFFEIQTLYQKYFEEEYPLHFGKFYNKKVEDKELLDKTAKDQIDAGIKKKYKQAYEHGSVFYFHHVYFLIGSIATGSNIKS